MDLVFKPRRTVLFLHKNRAEVPKSSSPMHLQSLHELYQPFTFAQTLSTTILLRPNFGRIWFKATRQIHLTWNLFSCIYNDKNSYISLNWERTPSVDSTPQIMFFGVFNVIDLIDRHQVYRNFYYVREP